MVPCCSCNGVSARCVRCVCARAEQPCVSWLPERTGGCHNALVDSSMSASQCQRRLTSQMNSTMCSQVDTRQVAMTLHGSSSSASPASSDSGSQSCLDVCSVQPSIFIARPGVSSVSSTTSVHHDTPTPRSLPSLLTVGSTRVCTFQHIPKVLRNVWAGCTQFDLH